MGILHIFKHKLILVGGILIIGSASAATYQYANTNAISYYTDSKGQKVETPDHNSSGATALCNDGFYSHSQSRSGSCSGHGGVSKWLGALATTSSSSGTSDNSTSYTFGGASTTHVPAADTYKPPTTTPSVAAPTNYSIPAYTPPPVTCNQTLKAQYEDEYNSEVATSNQEYNQEVGQIQQQYNQQLGGMSSGLQASQSGNLAQSHQQELDSLQSDLNEELASINC
jgi:hypothetical protein